jgi:hypothetical protein
LASVRGGAPLNANVEAVQKLLSMEATKVIAA